MSKSIIFLVKSFLGNFCRHLAIFSGHSGAIDLNNPFPLKESKNFNRIEFKTEKKQMLRFASKIQKYTYDVQSTMANTIKPTSVQAVVVVEWSECSTYTPTIIVEIPL